MAIIKKTPDNLWQGAKGQLGGGGVLPSGAEQTPWQSLVHTSLMSGSGPKLFYAWDI